MQFHRALMHSYSAEQVESACKCAGAMVLKRMPTYVETVAPLKAKLKGLEIDMHGCDRFAALLAALTPHVQRSYRPRHGGARRAHRARPPVAREYRQQGADVDRGVAAGAPGLGGVFCPSCAELTRGCSADCNAEICYPSNGSCHFSLNRFPHLRFNALERASVLAIYCYWEGQSFGCKTLRIFKHV